MTWKNYELDSIVLKATEAITLWKTEKGIIELNKGALAVPIKLDDQRKGYIFHGHGKLLLDTIVETKEGAIGKPVEKEVNEPFLMLGDTEKVQQHLSTASKEDFTKMGYENQQGFVAKAEDLYDQFFERGRTCGRQSFGEEHGSVFAFQNKAGKLDVLVVKGSKMVYKAAGMVFVSSENKVVLKSRGEVVLSCDGKSFVIRK